MVRVWQNGHGSEAIWGIQATGSISSWIPLMVFAFLFGLSMDYEVFILARMRKGYDRMGSTRSAVVGGIGRTDRLGNECGADPVSRFHLAGVRTRDRSENHDHRARRRDPARTQL